MAVPLGLIVTSCLHSFQICKPVLAAGPAIRQTVSLIEVCYGPYYSPYNGLRVNGLLVCHSVLRLNASLPLGLRLAPGASAPATGE
jgi:hypothetical protein